MILRTVFLILSTASFVSATGGGYPDIQAVYRITLLNGKTIEGLIKLGEGGSNNFRMYGFCYECKNAGRINYSTCFFSLDKEVNVYGFSNNSCKSFYLDIADKMNIDDDPQRVYFDSSGVADTVTMISDVKKKYIARDSILIFFEPTSYTYLDTVDFGYDPPRKMKYSKIALKDMQKLELLLNPPSEWYRLLSDNSDKAQNKYNGENSSGDFIEAGWYHTIVSDSVLYNSYQPVILLNNNR